MNDIFQIQNKNLRNLIEEELSHWQTNNKVQRLWAGDTTLWTSRDENQWLGWLNQPVLELNEIASIEALQNEISEEGYEHIIVLGMGGSSLCPAVMAETFGKIGNNPRLQILDSTDPMQIRHLEESINLKKTIFIVSSKSGTTLEPHIFMQYFYSRLQLLLDDEEIGKHFLAITDPGTKLEDIAKKLHFRAIFYGLPSIGGRYSALSNFGMLPAALMGINIKNFLYYAEKMAQACSPPVPTINNPGVLLGVTLGVCAREGINKITLIASPEIRALGAWLEQLLAESTGKVGKGLIPVDNEPLGQPGNYGKDRIFVYLCLEDASDAEQEKAIRALEQSKYIVVRLKLPNKKQLGGEFFRWEFATAVAGSILSINPFDQPDVEASKKLAVELLEKFVETGTMQKPNALLSGNGIELLSNKKNAHEIKEHMIGNPSIEMVLRAHLNRVKLGDYVNLSAFIEMSEEHTELLQRCRVLIRDEKKVATCIGFGPRFLHSTGQDYKGGPNTGVFFQITAEHPNDIQIPLQRYSFGSVIKAQAEADFQVLVDRNRRVLRVHLGNDVTFGLQQFYKLIKNALQLRDLNYEG